MGFFSRNSKALDAGGVDEAPFETVRRSPRNTRTRPAADSRFDAGAPLDPADSTRRRARHRLIGAVALALAAIVFVPMLFNATPVAPADDIALQIPDRDTPFEGRRGVPDPARTPSRPANETPPAPAETPPVVQPAPVAVESKATDIPAPAVVEKPVEKTVEKVTEKTTEKAAADKPADRPKSAAPDKAPTDDPRALAALEGKPDSATKPAATAPAGGRSFAVQVAAYASADAARGERDRLVAGGLRAYTESVSTAQGLRVRVRLGPFASRDAADQARAKLKTLKLDGSVVPL